jgi:DNA polymerase-3 subunit gamma/tau
MSYVVLARKYRSRNFTEMVGQEHVVRALTNALASQRLHHAYLFTGTRGVGKTTVSRILAKSLNCQGPDGQGGITAEPCGVCQACQDIDAGRFVDYTELDAASNRGVDEVQSLLEQAVYKPVQGRFKVFMIDEVHMLTNTAFNAMLKTLEEPPEYLKFVLATTDPQKVPVTVLSRCLQFNLRPMAPETVRAHLEHVLASEGVPADAQALRLLARAARGSMRDALSLTDQAIAYGSGKLEEATVRQMLGSVDRAQVFKLIAALAEGDGKAVVETSEELRNLGLSAASTLEEMSVVLQRMAVLQAVPGAAEAADDTDSEAAELVRLAAALPADETQLLYSLCLHGRSELGLAPDEYAALTMVLLRLLAFKPGATAAEKKTLADVAPRTGAAVQAQVPAVAALPQPRATAAEPAPAMTGAAASPAASAPVAALPQAPTPSRPRLVPAVAAAVAEPATSAVAPFGPTAGAAAAPPGQVLAVHDARQPSGGLRPAAPPPITQDGERVLAVPVRTQTEPTARAEPRAEAIASPLVLTEEGDFWHTLVQQLVAQEAITALVRELALQSQLVARDTDQWLLRVERESLNQPTARERLANALRGAGHAVALAVEVGRVQDSPAKRNQKAAAEKQLLAEKIIFEDPFVQDMMREFGAKIVPGSIKPV